MSTTLSFKSNLKHFTEAAFANETEEQVAVSENRVVTEARLIFVSNTTQFSQMHVSFSVQLFQQCVRVGLILKKSWRLNVKGTCLFDGI